VRCLQTHRIMTYPCSISWLTCPACVSIVAIVSSCCSTSMLIYRIISTASRLPESDTHLVEHLRQLRQRLFDLFDILITLLDLSEGASCVAVSVRVEKLPRDNQHRPGLTGIRTYCLREDLRVFRLEDLLDLFGRRIGLDCT
jgi:hypothetical protein